MQNRSSPEKSPPLNQAISSGAGDQQAESRLQFSTQGSSITTPHLQALNKALGFMRAGDNAAAFQWLRQAVGHNPDDWQSHALMGQLLNGKDNASAQKAYRRALALNPQNADCWGNLAIILRQNGEVAAAEQAYEQALRINPRHVASLYNYANLRRCQKRYEEARSLYERAIAANPRYAAAHYNLAINQTEAADIKGAIAAYRSLLAIDPSYTNGELNLSLCLLLNGELKEGWRRYESRGQANEPYYVHFNIPRLKNLNDTAALTLITTEQGAGDIVQFARYLLMLEQRGNNFIVQTDAKLVALLKATGLKAKVYGHLDRLPRGIRLWTPIMSLPELFDTTLENIPASVPYLRPDAHRLAKWRDKIGARGLKVGFVWQGTPNKKVDEGRSIPLQTFAPLADMAGVRLISLQKNAGIEQIETVSFAKKIETLGEEFDNSQDSFLDTIAAMHALDLVISTDTAVAHVAGALARPLWVLLKRVPDFRWLMDRDDSPWYPTARLFRQKTEGNWEEVMQQVVAALKM